jgi:hypothetical protein
MQDITQNKTYITAIVAVVVTLLVGWFVLSRSAKSGDDSLLSSTSSLSPAELLLGQETLRALQNMESIKLDTSVLQDPIFTNLKDLTVIIPKQPVGRRNPFASF